MTSKLINNIFYIKKDKSENDDYIHDSVKEDTLNEEEKHKKMNNFFNKVKTIKYKGYDYELTQEDFFERNGKKYKTILNSEDAAIKVCEELSNKIEEDNWWIDPEFGSQENDQSKNYISLFGEKFINSKKIYIDWYRLDQIFNKPQFFSDGVESNDVLQGNLHDCWFISALSIIATKDYLLRGEYSDDILISDKINKINYVKLSTGVYPPLFHSFRKKGIFCFKFFKNFKWRYVLVDNRLPCNKIFNEKQTPNLLYGKCRDSNEFWVPMIEKAYAKLHGSYKAIESGHINDGLVDLTGMTSDKIYINRTQMKFKQKVDELWEILKKNSELFFEKCEDDMKNNAKFFIRNKTMMGCSVDSNRLDIIKIEKNNENYDEVVLNNNHTGILANHAYSILDAFEIPKPSSKKNRKTSRLLRIRNPWGNKEWKGKWCDDSFETKKNKERIEEKLNKKYHGTNEKINLSQDDGTFLMCFSDFRQIYNSIYICKNFPPNYIGIRIKSKWTPNDSGYIPKNNDELKEEIFCRNPQYYLEKKIDGMIFISLIQNDGRLNEGERYPFINSINKAILLIFKVTSKEKVNNLKYKIGQTKISLSKENVFKENLPKGLYIIMPSTTVEGSIGDYCLEMHFEDELIEGLDVKGINKVKSLENHYIEKLGGNDADWEIMTDFIKDYDKSISKQKSNFIIQKFKEILKDDDDFNYSHHSSVKMGKSFNQGNTDDVEDMDYEDF